MDIDNNRNDRVNHASSSNSNGNGKTNGSSTGVKFLSKAEREQLALQRLQQQREEQEKRQAEDVIYLSNEIDVRANWDVEQAFDLSIPYTPEPKKKVDKKKKSSSGF